MNKLKPKNREEPSKWIDSIWVTEIGACPKKFQFREFYKARKDPSTFAQCQGIAVDELFKLIAKSSNVNRPEVYKKVMDGIAKMASSNYRAGFYKTLPIYEDRIKTFFRTDRIGKAVFGNVFNLQAPLKCPIKDLGFNIDLPEEIVNKYSVSGKVDCLAPQRLLEVKSGSKAKERDFRQAIVYQRTWKVLKPKSEMGYWIIYLGKDGPKKRKADIRHWNFSKGTHKITEEIQTLLKETIEFREKLRANPDYPFKEWKPKSEECNQCSYRSVCRSRYQKLKLFLKNIWFKA